jgi:hypothetical protein
MTITVSTLPGFAYCYNDQNNAANGRSALVLASVCALDLKALSPAALAPQNPQEPYPSILQSSAVGGNQGLFPLAGGPTGPAAQAVGGFNLGQQVA